MIDYGELINNPKAAKIFDDMENFIQYSKLKIKQLIMSDQLTQPKKRINQICGIYWKKKTAEPRLKGYAG